MLEAIGLLSPDAAGTLLSALVFVAALSVSAGFITSGGKTFLAIYTMLWYMSLSAPDTPLDFLAPFRPVATLSALSLHLILSAVLIGMALGVDRWRRAQ